METRKILRNKYYLYMTEFFAGMSVMAVELAARKRKGVRESPMAEKMPVAML